MELVVRCLPIGDLLACSLLYQQLVGGSLCKLDDDIRVLASIALSGNKLSFMIL
jgi:hypothetical protein